MGKDLIEKTFNLLCPLPNCNSIYCSTRITASPPIIKRITRSLINKITVPYERSLRIHWRISTILKTSNKSVWSNGFWYVKVCIFWKCIQYSIQWDETQILKTLPSDKINGTKNALFFLSRAPTHRSFIFNLRFLYELKHKVRLTKTVCGIFHFRFRFVFY